MKTVCKKVVLVTGATDGLGKEVATYLAWEQATVLLHGRNPEKGEATRLEIQEETCNYKLKYYNADFASLDEVRAMAKKILADHDELDVLINNAGIGVRSLEAPRELSEDGYELRFTVNYLSHVLLTRQLLPLLQKSAPSRIINVASAGQRSIDFEDVMLERDYDDWLAYQHSKLAQVMFSVDLAKELRGRGVTVNSIHPATLMNTKMVNESPFFRPPRTSVEEGAEAVEYLAISPDLEGVTGKYFDGKKKAEPHAQAQNWIARGQLRELSRELIGLRKYERSSGAGANNRERFAS
jgi:NAD(P)-dependent dehydrogenase (short-subunit alcohol dehydrogenase family)